MKNNILQPGLLILLVICGCSCAVETETHEPQKQVQEEVLSAPPKRIDPNKFTSYLERKFMPQAELFGKFFQDRMQFHIVEEPDLTLYKQPVRELTFYHIDEELCKKKFQMGGDISESLIYTLGNFKLRPLDSLTKALAKQGPIIIREDGRKFLNSAFRNYEMTWSKQDRVVRYRTTSDSLGVRNYTYSEENPDYKLLLKTVKYGIQIQEEEAEVLEQVL